jgi:hypothetical protein
VAGNYLPSAKRVKASLQNAETFLVKIRAGPDPMLFAASQRSNTKKELIGLYCCGR